MKAALATQKEENVALLGQVAELESLKMRLQVYKGLREKAITRNGNSLLNYQGKVVHGLESSGVMGLTVL